MKVIVKDLQQTKELAIQFANTLRIGDVVLLSGDLGAGKTTFTQFVFKHLGVEGVVNSPTFAVLKTYEAKGIVLNHFDAYRINTSEAIECGFDEVISSGEGITFIEWSENIKELLPQNCIKINITLVDNARQFEIVR
ncbi:MAG: tRNA (adenosine(37)-N6)-threonylcarbamoyltransferase complex ATPase subunit type 1 TsaE [Clostridia bacterium]|nr:tRNA (adenosine(37)-N6)-threonylcarbamoyltransferase complex ATPase subunit type 1 TsaE [Clostridia bacterium]